MLLPITFVMATWYLRCTGSQWSINLPYFKKGLFLLRRKFSGTVKGGQIKNIEKLFF